ncbi:hypothetical protein Tco_0713168 [Tanacetum coccineum]
MPTKIRLSKRLVNLPVKFNDHIMMYSTQKDNQTRFNGKDPEIRNDVMENEDLTNKNSDMNESDDTFWESSEDNPMEINKDKFILENSQDNVNKDHGKSYAAAVQNKSQTLDTSLNFRLTVTDDDGCCLVRRMKGIIIHITLRRLFVLRCNCNSVITITSKEEIHIT